MHPIKSILIPVDFSEHSHNALGYAAAMARLENAKIYVLHISDTSEETKRIKKNESSETLMNRIDNDELLKDIDHQCVILKGKVVREILHMQKRKKIDLIVMGTQGADQFTKEIFGTNTSSVIEQAGCPVLAVPAKLPYSGFRKVVFATDMSSYDLVRSASILPFIRSLRAELLFLHVNASVEKKIETVYKLSEVSHRIKRLIDYPEMSMYVSSYKNVNEGIESFMGQKKADLLVMITHPRTFLQSLFASSKTKKMVYHTRVPLLALPAARS